MKNALPITGGFARAGVYSRPNICANLQVHRPPEYLCNPRPRKAAGTLAASERERRRESLTEKEVHLENVVGVCRRKSVE